MIIRESNLFLKYIFHAAEIDNLIFKFIMDTVNKNSIDLVLLIKCFRDKLLITEIIRKITFSDIKYRNVTISQKLFYFLKF